MQECPKTRSPASSLASPPLAPGRPPGAPAYRLDRRSGRRWTAPSGCRWRRRRATLGALPFVPPRLIWSVVMVVCIALGVLICSLPFWTVLFRFESSRTALTVASLVILIGCWKLKCFHCSLTLCSRLVVVLLGSPDIN